MSKCRSCGAKIIWIRTAAGKMMPCNPEKIHYRRYEGAGTPEKILVTPDGNITMGTPDPSSDLYGYVSHFATCPAAAAHRKKGKK